MAAAPTHTRNRRRKKRRTEDFSSDSDSDLDSSASEQETTATSKLAPQLLLAPETHVNIDDIDIESDTEKPLDVADDGLLEKAKEQLLKVKFTQTDNLALHEAKHAVNKDRQQLDNEYLAFMAGQFANDLDELRKKPDFSELSIVMLAKTLQLGLNMFDDETLDALLK